MMAVKLLKHSSTWDLRADRIFILTTERIYTFNSNKRSRQYRIRDLGAIIKCTTNFEFMLFFPQQDDLRVSSKDREDLLNIIKLRFNCLNRDITLPVFGVDERGMKVFHQTNNRSNKRAGIHNLPEDNQRVKVEEIQGEKEFNA